MGLREKFPYPSHKEKIATNERGHWNFAEFPFDSPNDPKLAKAIDDIPKEIAAFILRFETNFHGEVGPKLIKTYLEEIGLIIDHLQLPTSYLKLNALLNTDLEQTNLKAQKAISIAWEKIFNQYYQILKSIPEEVFLSLVNSPELESFKSFLIKSYEKAKNRNPENDHERELLSLKEVDLKSQYSQLRVGIKILSNTSELIGVTETYRLLPLLKNRSDKKLIWERLMRAFADNSTEVAELLVRLTEIRIKEAKLIKSNPLTEKLNNEEISLEAIESLKAAARKAIPLRVDIQQIIAEYHGIEKLEPWDFLPETSLAENVSYKDAIVSIASAWNKIGPQFGKLIEDMDKNGWICISRGPKISNLQININSPIHSFPKIYFDGSIASLKTLAHELGHALYRYLSINKKLFTGKEPYNHLNEMVALFSEKIASREYMNLHQISNVTNPTSFFGGELTIILQNLRRHDFESQVFQSVSKGETLTADEFNQIHNKSRKMWGYASSPEASLEWVGTPHFFTHPNYVWTYSVGEALAGTLEQLYIEDQTPVFGSKMVDMLQAGSSKTSRELFNDYFSLDINKPEFWEKAFLPIKKRLEEFRKQN